VTTFEQALQDAYGTPEQWERERHGTAQEAQSAVYGTPLHWRHRRLSPEVERLRVERERQE
jgi:hypothetical protein